MASILLIDDNAPLRTMMAHALTLAGHRVAVAENGKAGVRSFVLEPVDLVITDLVMPDQDGLETIMLLRKSHPGVPVIAISGDAPRHAAVYLSMASKLGAIETLLKPFTVAALVSAVGKVLARSNPAGGNPP